MTEDDVEFKPNESTISNLTSLFDSNKPHSSGNYSLTYIAPKAPKAGESCGILKQSGSKRPSNEKLKIITSKSVKVYKLENGNYVNQGTAGIAIVGNHGLHFYQVILYKNSKEHLCKTPVTPNFSLTVLENNYVSFYDNCGQNWSILFSSSSNVHEFAKQVAVAKYNSQINDEKIIIQDLSPMGGGKTKERDVIKVSYSCNVLENDEVVPWKEKETVSVELSDVNAFPWHEGIRDWNEQGKRIVIIPYKLSAPWTNDLSRSSCVVMELEMVSFISADCDKTLGQKEKEEQKADEGDRDMKIQGENVKENSGEEEYYKGKGTSLKDSVFLSRSHKTDLISRIARVGQAFPVRGALLSGHSDSEDECSPMPRSGVKLSSVKNAIEQFHQSLPIHLRQCSAEADNSRYDNSKNEIGGENDENGSQEQSKTRIGRNVVVHELEPCRCPKGKDSEKDRCSGTRCVNDELRMSIDKLLEKVDEVLKKLENFDFNKWDRSKENESSGVVDTVNVLASVLNAIAENENLKTEMELHRRIIDEQSKKIETLTDLTKRWVEKFSVTEKKQSVEEGGVACFEKQFRVSEEFTSEANSGINESPSDAERYRTEESSENRRVGWSDDFVGKSGEKEIGVHDPGRKLNHMVAEEGGAMSSNAGGKEEMLNYKTEEIGETSSSSKAPQNISREESFGEIKRVMNAVNKKLQGYFEPDMNYSGSEVKEIIASTIKDVTVEYLRYKSKPGKSSRMEFSVRHNSETGFEGRRGRKTDGTPQGAGSPSDVKETLNAGSCNSERNSGDITNVISSRVVLSEGKDTGDPRLDAKKSQSRAGEAISSRSVFSPEGSGLSRVSNVMEASGERGKGEDGKESASEMAEDSDSDSRTLRFPCVNESQSTKLDESVKETGCSGKGSSAAANRTLTDVAEESVTGSSSRRSCNREGMEGNGMIAAGAVRVKSEIVGIDVEGKRRGKNPRDEISVEKREEWMEPLSPRFTSRAKSENLGVNVETTAPDEKEGLENGEVEKSVTNSTVREPDEEKKILFQPVSDMSNWKAENKISDTNETASSGIKRNIAGASDAAGSVVRMEIQNGGSNESTRGESFVSGNAVTHAADEEGSDDSRTEKAGSSSETTIWDAMKAGEATRQASTVSGLGGSIKEESDLRHIKSNPSEIVESRPFPAESAVIRDKNAMSLGRITGEEFGDCDEACEDYEKSVIKKWEADGKVRSTEAEAKDEGNEMEGTEEESVKSLFTDYCYNWVLSKPPPLPPDDDDGEEDDEEWL